MLPFKKKFPYKRYKKASIKEANIDTIVSDSESDEDVPTRAFKKTGAKLIIVESPAKCKKIESFLGNGYKCIASFGHFREITSPDNIKINADAGTLDIKYTNMKTASMRKAISTMKSEAEKASEVIIATDDDREGEAIGWHICSLLKLNTNTTSRAIFHEVTRDAVVSGVEGSSRVRLNMDLVQAQKTRQAIDMIVGYGVSPALWASGLSKPGKNVPALSAGRCQSPALQIVIDEDEISRNSVNDSTIFKVHGLFTRKNIRFDLTRTFDTKDVSIDFLSQSGDHEHRLLPSPPLKTTVRFPPNPLTTSKLQQVCSNVLSISPKQAMSSCQRLYEAGFITYMRTDATAYSVEFIDSAKRFIEQTFNDTKYISKTADTLASTGTGAHESIRPTNAHLRQLPETVTEPQDRKVYKIIWETAIGSLMAFAEYSRLVVRLSAPQHDTHYEAVTESPIFLGWEILHPRSQETTNNEFRDYAYLKTLIDTTSPGTIPYSFVRAVETPTAPRPRPTEARLVRLLEEKGIGRPSTFSSLVEKIQDRGYVKRSNVKGSPVQCDTYELTSEAEDITVETTERVIGGEKNKLLVNPVGVAVSEYLQTHFAGLFNYDYTSAMETRLEAVAAGRENAAALCAEVRTAVNAAVAAAPVAATPPPPAPAEEDDETEPGWEYDDLPVKVKKGRYGLFARWGEVNVKLPFGNRPMNNIRYEEVVEVLKRKRR
jgi:DNA topoisomerase-1